MKQIALYILVAAIALAGCSDKYSDDLNLSPDLAPHYISVSTKSLVFTAKQPISRTVNIKAIGAPWKVDNSVDWITLSAESGQADANLIVSAAENEYASARAGVFYVQADVNGRIYERAISVSQYAAEPYVNVSQSSIELPGKACSASFNVTANCDFEVTNTDDWLTATRKDSTVTLSVTANETNAYRTTRVCVSYMRVTKVVIITQAPASISASTETVTFDGVSTEATVNVTAEGHWSAATSYM